MDEAKVERRMVKGTDRRAGSVEGVLGFHRLGKQDPYFHALAGEWVGSEQDYLTCANHDLLRATFPEVAHLTRWHLVALHEGPMHYVANALYFAEQTRGIYRYGRRSYDPDPVEAFKTTVVWGASPEHDVGEPWAMADQDALVAFLRARLPKVMETFRAEVEAAFPGMWADAEGITVREEVSK